MRPGPVVLLDGLRLSQGPRASPSSSCAHRLGPLSSPRGRCLCGSWDDGTREGARGGYGLTAEPSVFLEEITASE